MSSVNNNNWPASVVVFFEAASLGVSGYLDALHVRTRPPCMPELATSPARSCVGAVWRRPTLARRQQRTGCARLPAPALSLICVPRYVSLDAALKARWALGADLPRPRALRRVLAAYPQRRPGIGWAANVFIGRCAFERRAAKQQRCCSCTRPSCRLREDCVRFGVGRASQPARAGSVLPSPAAFLRVAEGITALVDGEGHQR